jgi:hypothetical protein
LRRRPARSAAERGKAFVLIQESEKAGYNQLTMQYPFVPEHFSEEPKSKSWFLTEPQMKFVTTVLSLAVVLIGVFGHQKKDVIALLVIVPGAVFLLTVLPTIANFFKRIYRRGRQRRFVDDEYPRLQRLYERMLRYADQNDGRSLRNILYAASAYQHDIVLRILHSDYIWTWMQCFRCALNDEKPRSLWLFMRLCNQFTAIIAEYNRNYVLKAQRGIEQTPLGQEYIIDQLEQFREDFNHFLREVEEGECRHSRSAEGRARFAQ